MALEIVYRPEGRATSLPSTHWLSDLSDPGHALAYVDRIQTACEGLADFPRRGSRREALEPGMRSIPFERRATIYCRIGEEAVEIVRILYAGRDATREFGDR